MTASAIAAPPAAATDPETVALFEDGRRLMAKGDYIGAIAKFQQILQRARPVGALLNLGECYAKTGRTASAWATFRMASSVAAENNDQERRAVADEHTAQLEPTLSKITIKVEGDTPDLEIRRDGEVVARAEWGTALPIDPGGHRIEASAPGAPPWSQTIDITGPSNTTINVPSLLGPRSSSSSSTQPTEDTKDSSGSSQRTIGFIVGGVGIAALAFGSVAGILAKSSRDDAEAICPSYPVHCPTDLSAQGPNDDAQQWATISTISFVAGIAALAGGAVLVFTAPKNAPATKSAFRVVPALGPHGASMTLGATWR